MKKILLSWPVFILAFYFGTASAQHKPEEITILMQDGKTFKIEFTGDTIILGSDTGTLKKIPLSPGIIKGPFVYKNEFWNLDTGKLKSFNQYFRNLLTNRPYLGVKTIRDDKGVKIEEVVTGSPADKSGLEKGDVITFIDEKPVSTPEKLLEVVSGLKPDQKVTVSYLRHNKKQETAVVLGKNNGITLGNIPELREFSFRFPDSSFRRNAPFRSPEQFYNLRPAPAKPKLGMRVQEKENGHGVTVLSVTAESPADKAGIQDGDIIIEINGQKINGVGAAQKEIRDIEGSEFPVRIQRNKKSMDLIIKVPRDLKKADL